MSQTTIIAPATDFSGGNASDESLIARRAIRAAARVLRFVSERPNLMLRETRAVGWKTKRVRVGIKDRPGLEAYRRCCTPLALTLTCGLWLSVPIGEMINALQSGLAVWQSEKMKSRNELI
jgi:hypothetical protein